MAGARIEYKLDYKPHWGQEQFHASRARFRELACGRGFGKDWCCEMDVIGHLPEMVKMNAGKGLIPNVNIWFVAPTYPASEQVWSEIKARMPAGFIEGIGETDRVIRTKGGGEIWIRSADNPRALVGVGLDLLVVTESGMVAEQAWQESLRPTLSRPGRLGRALFNGTPKGLNWFYRMYLRGQDPLDKEVESWNFPSWYNVKVWNDRELLEAVGPCKDREEAEKKLIEGLNAKTITMLPADIEAAKKELPDSTFRQEYGAEFLSESGQVFRHVDGCIQGKLEEPVPGHGYVMGVDLAKVEDFTVLTVADRWTHRIVGFERFNEIDYKFQKESVANLARKYNNSHCWVDATGVGIPLLEDLQEMGRKQGFQVDGYGMTGDNRRTGKVGSKTLLMDALIIAIEQEKIRFPAIPQLLNELRAYQYEVTKAGNVRMNAPSGYHDDCPVSLALCNWGLEQSPFWGGKVVAMKW